MSFYSAMMADHLNKIDAGRFKLILPPTPESSTNMTAKVYADKYAFALNTVGMGLLHIMKRATP